MNKKEQKKRKVIQHTVYYTYEQEALRKRLNLKVSDYSNYGYKRILEERKSSEEIKLELKIDVLKENVEDLEDKLETAKEKLANAEYQLKELKRFTPEIKEKVFSEMNELFISFEEEYLAYYEKHPEEESSKLEAFYSSRTGSISSLGRKYKLTEEEVISIYEESLAIEEALSEFDSIVNAKHIE